MLVKYEDLELDVIQSNEHEWLLSTELVAKGYGVSEVAIRSHKTRRPDELCEGKHFVTGGVANCNADNVKEGEQKSTGLNAVSSVLVSLFGVLLLQSSGTLQRILSLTGWRARKYRRRMLLLIR